MADGDYIVLSRKILQWEWYKNPNTKSVFLHCLLKANWCDGKYEGIEVPRGSFVIAIKDMAKDLGLSYQQTRTALEHLISTSEITIKGYSKYSIITVNNYNQYQLTNEQINEQVTSNQRASNEQVTSIKEEGMNREEENGEEKGAKEERERTKEKEERESKVEDREVEKSKEVEGKRREEGIKEKESKKENKTEVMENSFKKYSEQFPLSDSLYDKLKEWCLYKIQRKEYYVDRGVKNLVKKTSDMAREYGDIEVCNVIEESMASNYQGIVWDKLNNRRKSKRTLEEIWRDA